MIARHCFANDWIQKQREKHQKADPYLIERQLAAFELVGLLVQSGTPFVFKGGTALILLLPVARRLSIDVDIVGDFTPDILSELTKGSIFSRVIEDQRKGSSIPKRHFRFYYTSVVDTREAYVLLDVLYADHGFDNLVSTPVRHELFEVESPFRVRTPTINGMTGDKLTAFAPRTIGVPFGAGKSMQIAKQLFDIGELFDHCDHLAEISSAYARIREQQLVFRMRDRTAGKTLDDTINAAFLLSQARFRGSVDNREVRELVQGIGQLKNYLLGTHFTLDDARLSASKAALLAALLRRGTLTTDLAKIRFKESMIDEIREVTLEGDVRILNKLKAVQPTALYYWRLACEL
jgi:hypothetical protein